MTEVRINPLTGESVVVAATRALRPHDTKHPSGNKPGADSLDDCPFCPGHEDRTPGVLLTVPGPQAAAPWSLMVVPNRYPALEPNPQPPRDECDRLFASRPGRGAHEVLVETPEHHRHPAEMSTKELALVFRTARDRIALHAATPYVEYITYFKNHGHEAGASLNHPHSQIVAADFVPDRERRKSRLAAKHRELTARCIVCDLLREELRKSTRVVFERAEFVAFCPFFSAQAGETWIVPKRHPTQFQAVSENLIAEFGDSVRRVLRTLDRALHRADFNWILEMGPLRGPFATHGHWYLRVVPRVTIFAGFELGTGIQINLLPPEEAAQTLRELGAE